MRGRSAKYVIGLVMFVRFVRVVNIIDNIVNTVELERVFLVSTKNGACENEFFGFSDFVPDNDYFSYL